MRLIHRLVLPQRQLGFDPLQAASSITQHIVLPLFRRQGSVARLAQHACAQGLSTYVLSTSGTNFSRAFNFNKAFQDHDAFITTLISRF